MTLDRPMIIQTILVDPSGAVQADAEHPAGLRRLAAVILSVIPPR
jgi:hypothetical protein